ncbi:MAG TPA: ABC transporter permease [Phototrophicaceae bacterium]|nr:ABC transporter permease [Phototrophicaceae bacterium]
MTTQEVTLTTTPSGVSTRSPIQRLVNSISVEAIYGIWLRDLKKFWRERSRLWGGIARPVLWLLILGTSLKPAISSQALSGTTDYTHYIFPGVLGLTLIFSAMQSATSIIWDREFGFLKEVLAAPVPRLSVIIGKSLGGASQATLQGMITLLFAPLIGLWIPAFKIVELIALMFLIGFALTTMGVVIASRMTSFEGFGTISNFVVMPMYFLSGAIYLISNAPDWIRAVAVFNPLAYGVDSMRHISIGIGLYSLWLDAGFLIVFSLVMLAIAYPMFKRE